MPLILTPLPKIPMVQPGNNLVEILLTSLQTAKIVLEDGDILVFAQKIISKAENRLINLNDVKPSGKALELADQSQKDPRLVELILQESNEIMRVRPGTIIVEHRLGFVCANAGIDHSNVLGENRNPEDWVLLLPVDPDHSALEIRRNLKIATGNRLGVMIIDSHGRAWRNGTIGTAIGISGIPGLVDKRGWHDLFGYRLKITMIAAGDGLAAAASLAMGEAAEGTPVVHVRGFPYPLREGSLKELLRPREQDLFR